MTATTGLTGMICFDLYSASRAVTAVYRRLLEPLGLTYPQYLVMVSLWDRDGRTVRELIDALDLDYGTVSPLLKRLQGGGLLERTRRPDDERTVLVTLTGAGRALRERAAGVPDAIRAALGLDEEETAALHDVLQRVGASAARASSTC